LRGPPPADIARRFPHILKQHGGIPALHHPNQPKAWLGIRFNCCQTYGRIYRNATGTLYEGRCPRCGVTVSARVGPGGTKRRFFETT